jgi:hypothetical protein
MILCRVIPPLILILSSCMALPAAPNDDAPDRLPPASLSAVLQDFNKAVVSITELKFLGPGLESKFGMGFRLDPACRFIATNYHVAMLVRPHKIKGEKVVQLYLATRLDDEGATVNDGPSVSPKKYTP